MKVDKQLVNNLPTHLRQHPNVEQLFEALGEVLEEMRVQIDEFKYAQDSQQVDQSKVNNLGETFGVNYPRNLNRENKRNLIRDIISIYRSKGTERAIKQVFKLVGWQVDIDYLWIDKNVSKDSYTYPDDYYFGKDVVYSDGVFADVVDSSGNVFDKTHIYGEIYDVTVEGSSKRMMKTPYIKVTITAEDYELFTEDFVDTDGTVLTFTETEKFNIVQEIFDFFIEKGRPANVAIVEVATPFTLTDEVNASSNFTENDTGNFTDAEIATSTDSSSVYKPNGNPFELVDRDYALMHAPMVLFSHGEYFHSLDRGTNEFEVITSGYPTYASSDPTPFWGVAYDASQSGTQETVPVTEDARLKITCDADTDITVYRTARTHYEISQGNTNYQIVDTLSGPLEEYTLSTKYAFAVALNITRNAGSDHHVVMEIGYFNDPVTIADWDTRFGDDWGSVGDYAHFFVPNGFIDETVDINWDFGDTTLV